ncbi:RlpA-like protein precursor [Actinomadura rubteroloni]|uniref:Probable endolytic peptidoglycan transglycosylase RlpA n=1 Tax=Actinomadura rubteroloni TaxID=1926885 RepID=A0A2P4ULQ1_9ACTN|nr:septal ring lytic transglycosylase RlpA family protein [Actinomadura rubteroloni]POM25978.1 RlpA-like protein precursor [Actinomadura rubteroloni]
MGRHRPELDIRRSLARLPRGVAARIAASGARLRTVLIVSGAAVAVLAVSAGTVLATGGSGPRPAAAAQPTAAPLADAPRATPSATPTRTRKARPAKPLAQSVRDEKPKPKPKVLDSGTCEASFYGEGQMTASGEPFDPSGLTAAHKTLPLGSKVRVTNQNNGKSVVVRINDRGPFVAGRCLDLSTGAMSAVGGMGSGVIPVRYEVLSRG